MGFSALVLTVVAMATAGVHHTETGCFEHPAQCGYPAVSNTGVPPGTQLKKSGSIEVDDPGTVLTNLQVEGTVTVSAPDVTIRDSVISPPDGGSGSFAIELREGADDFTLESSEVAGRDPRNGLESAVWNHDGVRNATAIDSYLHGCADCWEGPGNFNRDLIVVDASYPGSHDEDIYVCGGAVRVEHSTLINRHDQTATVFGDTSGCGGNHFVVTENLLAGGGYVLYPQANSDSSVGYMKVTRNRFARCRGNHSHDPRSGGTECSGGPNESGIWAYGGYFGVAAYYYLDGRNVWKENFWDDNLEPVCLQRHC